MIIGGLQKNSFIDCPGKIAAVVFTAGCNLRCPYCHNFRLLSADNDNISLDELYAFLQKRRNQLEAVVISGGEPTIHSDLPELMRNIKKMDFALKLDTNGTRPQMLETLIEQALPDYVAMDLKAVFSEYANLSADGNKLGDALEESMRLIGQSGLPGEFRITCAAPFINEQSIVELASLLTTYAPHLPLWLQPVKWENSINPAYAQNFPPPSLERLRQLALTKVNNCHIR
ncbi:MAG: anaerobic ribonucleoside-triphosphate reductase activating protein [Desulfovibrionaceae bacterium]|nr:anaerobic ribonucleoside-triphosphate reductase activating protein [Desulfovibrionaceae bacterium]